MTGKELRQWFRGLFGSRLVETLENNFNLILAEKEVSFNHLTEEMARMRSDYESRLQDKDNQISELRQEKAMFMGKIHLYETTLMPLSSRAGADIVAAGKPRKPNFPDFNAPPVKSKWQQVVETHEEELAQEAKLEDQRRKDAVAQASSLGGK